MTCISHFAAVVAIKLSRAVTSSMIDTINTCSIVLAGINHAVIDVDITAMSCKSCRTVAGEVIESVNTSAIVETRGRKTFICLSFTPARHKD